MLLWWIRRSPSSEPPCSDDKACLVLLLLTDCPLAGAYANSFFFQGDSHLYTTTTAFLRGEQLHPSLLLQRQFHAAAPSSATFRYYGGSGGTLFNPLLFMKSTEAATASGRRTEKEVTVVTSLELQQCVDQDCITSALLDQPHCRCW